MPIGNQLATTMPSTFAETTTAPAEMWALPQFRPQAGPALARSFALLDEQTLLRRLPRVSKEDILHEWRGDPWFCNYLVNLWEFVMGEDTLTSYPYNVTIPIADVCNARCTFCSSWLEGTKVLAVEEVSRFAEVLRYAKVLGLAGHGEPLAHPHCEELFAAISTHLDPRCRAYLITNGAFLEKQHSALSKLPVNTYNISLNATTAAVHETVMGLGTDAFERIIESLRGLIRRRDTEQPDLRINISMVITQDNVHQLAEFIDLGNSMGVNQIYLRTLAPQSALPIGLNYHRLPPYLHPRFREFVGAAEEKIAQSRAEIITDAESWKAPVFSEPVERMVTIAPPADMDRKHALSDRNVRAYYAGYYDHLAQGRGFGEPLELPAGSVADPQDDGLNPYGRTARLHCSFVYQDFIINDFNLRLIPCCYMANVPGFDVVRYDGAAPFLQYWNSPAFRAARRRLREGPLFGACKKCPAQPAPPMQEKVALPEGVDRNRWRNLYDRKGWLLRRNLRATVHDGSNGRKAIVLREDGILFVANSSQDHLATSFVNLPARGGWVRVQGIWPRSEEELANCIFAVQDQNYRILPAILKQRQASEPPGFESYVEVPEDVRQVRLMLTARDQKPALFPYHLRIGQIEK